MRYKETTKIPFQFKSADMRELPVAHFQKIVNYNSFPGLIQIT